MCAMKISLAVCLVILVITVTQSYASEVISNGGNEEIKTENGTDIRITKPEFMEVIVSNHELTFEVCTMNCTTDFLVCYEPDPPEQIATNFFAICDNNCGFYVTGDVRLTKNNFTVGYMGHAVKYQTMKIDDCDVATMSLNEFEFRVGGSPRPSCKPQIENGYVKLNVSVANTGCPITIRNAHFKRDPTTTTSLPSDSSTSSSGKSSSNIFGNLEWIFVLLSICFLQQ